MNGVVLVLVIVLLIVGAAGSVLQFLPGVPLIFAAALLHSLASGGEPVGIGRLVVLALMGAVACTLEYAAGVLGAKRAGGSSWAVVGAVVGGLVGLLFGPVGLILGPVQGAVGGELM